MKSISRSLRLSTMYGDRRADVRNLRRRRSRAVEGEWTTTVTTARQPRKAAHRGEARTWSRQPRASTSARARPAAARHVDPKARAGHEILVSAARRLTDGPSPSRGAAGKRVWKVIKFWRRTIRREGGLHRVDSTRRPARRRAGARPLTALSPAPAGSRTPTTSPTPSEALRLTLSSASAPAARSIWPQKHLATRPAGPRRTAKRTATSSSRCRQARARRTPALDHPWRPTTPTAERRHDARRLPRRRRIAPSSEQRRPRCGARGSRSSAASRRRPRALMRTSSRPDHSPHRRRPALPAGRSTATCSATTSCSRRRPRGVSTSLRRLDAICSTSPSPSTMVPRRRERTPRRGAAVLSSPAASCARSKAPRFASCRIASRKRAA